MTENAQLTVTDELPYDRVAAIIREAVVVLGFVGFVVLGRLLPGAGRELGRTGISVGDLVLAIGTLGIVATMLFAAPKLRRLVEASLEGPTAIVADAAAIAQYVLVFVAVVIAYRGFAPVAVPFVDNGAVYDVAFLVFAAIPLGIVAYRFYHALDPVTAFLTTHLLGRGDATDGPVRTEHRG